MENLAVTDEEQALMAIKLADNVRALIREEIRIALEDPGFIGTANLYTLHNRIVGMHSSDSAFRSAVKAAITQIMNNSYG